MLHSGCTFEDLSPYCILILSNKLKAGCPVSSHYDYSPADWADNLRDVPWEDIFKLGASDAVSEFCEWVQVGINVYIIHRKYQVKPHSSLSCLYFKKPFATITSLCELYFRFRRFILLVQTKKVISIIYSSSTSS